MTETDAPRRAATAPARRAPRPQPPRFSLHAGPTPGVLTDLPNNQYRLAAPLDIIVELADDKVIVSDAHVNLYGTGRSLQAAAADYAASLLEYLGWLEAHEATLAAHLRDHLLWCRRHLVRREAA